MKRAGDRHLEPLVSVVIPLYNQRRYLDACLQSICDQTYRNLEVLVVNDGSTDDSPDLAKCWAEKDSRIRVIDKANEGAIMARRDGYRQAAGEYIAFVDSDDLLPKNAIAALAGIMTEKGVDLVIGSMTKKLGFIKKTNIDKPFSFPCHEVVKQPELFDKYYLGFFLNSIFPVSMCGRMYRKAVMDKAWNETKLFDEEVTKMGEDQFFNMKLFPFLRSMYRIDDEVYIYRYGGGTNRFNPNYTQLFVSSDKRLKQLDYYNYTEGYGPLFDEYVACLYFHASRLISCGVTDRQGVIDFFKHEMETRELMPRLLEHYAAVGAPDRRSQLMLNRDFEGMYQCAFELLRQRSGSVKAKIRHHLINWLLRWS